MGSLVNKYEEYYLDVHPGHDEDKKLPFDFGSN